MGIFSLAWWSLTCLRKVNGKSYKLAIRLHSVGMAFSIQNRVCTIHSVSFEEGRVLDELEVLLPGLSSSGSTGKDLANSHYRILS